MNSITAERNTKQLDGIDGWVLKALIEVDVAATGTLAWAMGASPLRRQIIFLALAARRQAKGGASCDLEPEALAAALRSAPAHDFFIAVLGTAPEGLTDVLSRFGPVDFPRANRHQQR